VLTEITAAFHAQKRININNVNNYKTCLLHWLFRLERGFRIILFGCCFVAIVPIIFNKSNQMDQTKSD
jgi:hypothetical protein